MRFNLLGTMPWHRGCMETPTHLLTPIPIATGAAEVVALNCGGPAHFDPTPLRALCDGADLGAADAMICDLLEEIALHLDALHRSWQRRDLSQLPQSARRIEALADEYGLIEVAVSAAHLVRCVAQGDPVALGAVMGRLERGFDVAVAEVWAFRDA